MYDKIYDKVVKSDSMKKYHDLGTPVNIIPLNKIGALPTRNLTSARFEGAENISGEAIAETMLARRVACSHCPVACIHIAAIREEYPHEKYFYTTKYVSYDYEPLYALGTMLGISDKEGVLRLIEEVEVEGLDAMSTGVALAWATEAFQRGIITEKETIVKPSWGDWRTYIQMVKYIVEQPNEFYRKLGEGTEEAAKTYGGVEFAMTFGKNEMPGYHAGPATHLGYVIGARHSHLDNAGYSYDQKLIGKEYPPPEKVIDDLMKEEAWRQILSSLVVCFFARKVYTPELVAEGLEALGIKIDAEGLKKLGWEIYAEKYRLKLDMGFDLEKDLKLPKRIFETPSPHGKISEEFMQKALDHFRKRIKELTGK